MAAEFGTFRWHGYDTWQRQRTRMHPLNLRELREVYERLAVVDRTPVSHGVKGDPASRTSQLRRLAEAYGLSTRTLERYRHRRLIIVRCEGWEAAFTIGRHDAPRQLTPWERA